MNHILSHHCLPALESHIAPSHAFSRTPYFVQQKIKMLVILTAHDKLCFCTFMTSVNPGPPTGTFFPVLHLVSGRPHSYTINKIMEEQSLYNKFIKFID